MNDIHSRIQREYATMQNEYKAQSESFIESLHAKYPEIAKINSQIASLSLKSARMIIKGELTQDMAFEYVKTQSEKLKNERERLLTEYGISEYVPDYKCKICKDTGLADNGKKCGCYMKKVREYLSFPDDTLKNGVLDTASFDNFKLSYYPKEKDAELGVSPRDIMKAVYSRCAKFVSSFSGENSGNLLLCGPSGLGKTLMAASVANAVSDKGYLTIYKSAYKIFQFMEDYKFGKINREEYAHVYNSLYDCDLLVIDDFGTEFITSFTQSAFFDILSSRLDAGKSIVISTNLPLERIADIYQERVMSRLKNEFEVLRFAGEDIRALKNK